MTPRGATTDRRRHATDGFFEELASRHHEPLLHDTKGTLRIDLQEDGSVDHYYVTIADGSVTIKKKAGEADSVIRLDRRLFDRMTQGKANATAALLRGTMAVEGDVGILTAFQRLFPGPPRSRLAYSERRRDELS